MSTRAVAWRLGVPAAADAAQGAALAAAAGAIGSTLGLRTTAVVALLGLHALAVAGGGFLVVALGYRNRRWWRSARIAAVVSPIATAAAAIATGPWGLVVSLLAGGLARGAAQAVHPALIAEAADGVPVRALALHRGLSVAGLATGPVLYAALTAGGLTWRAVALVSASVGALAVLAVLRLGRTEAAGGMWAGADPALGSAEGARRLLATPSVPWLLGALAGAASITGPLLPFLLFWLDDRWRMTDGETAAVVGALALAAVCVLGLFAAEAEQRHATNPARAVRVTAALLLAGGGLFATGLLVGATGPMIALLAAAVACLVLVQFECLLAVLRLAPPELRVHAGALAGLAAAVATAGGLLGLGSFGEDVGPTAALAWLGTGAVPGALSLLAAGRRLLGDLDAMVGMMAEREEARGRQSVPPVLACRGLVFGYDERHALDGVDLTLARGEIVAVLGTNGAGKSTMLKAISGLVHAQRGSVRLDGQEITHLEPERRRRLGIAHIVGGESTFGTLTVADSLRLAAHAAGLRGGSAELAVFGALAKTPLLAVRRDVRAASLSGGERHLLGLTQALLLQPRLLLVDELSMSLSPTAIGEVIALVRAVHERGAGVVVVDQSVDVALSVASRAVFLDRGRVLFDGPADELRTRDDLLRSVFLAGAVTGAS